MKKARMAICLAVLMFVVMAGQGFAEMYLQDGGTYNITTEISVPVYVDLVMPENPTTVNILDGANLYGEPVSIQSNNNAYINISGGGIGYLKVNDNSNVNIFGGYVDTAYASDFSTVDISDGGYVSGLHASGNSTINISDCGGSNIYASDNSTVDISGGYVDTASASGNSTITMSGTSGRELIAFDNGTINTCSDYSNGSIQSYNNSIINISGGGIVVSLYANDNSTMNLTGAIFDSEPVEDHSELNAYGNSTVNISDGSFTGFITSRGTSTVNIYSGSFGRVDHSSVGAIKPCGGLYVHENSTMNIFSGDIEYISASEKGIINISGGNISELYALDFSSIIFDGYDFVLGTGLSWNIDGGTILGTGILTGKWFDGTSWSVNIMDNYDTSTIMTIPEPATLLLFGIGGLVLRRRHRG